MIKTIIIALFAVSACYFFPATPAEYTELINLEENTKLSAMLFVAMWMFCRNIVGYSIMAIEAILIIVNHYLAWVWNQPFDSIFAVYYSQIQDAAFVAELAIIILTIFTGLRQIGAELHYFNNWIDARSSSGNFRERYK